GHVAGGQFLAKHRLDRVTPQDSYGAEESFLSIYHSHSSPPYAFSCWGREGHRAAWRPGRGQHGRWFWDVLGSTRRPAPRLGREQAAPPATRGTRSGR